MPISIEKVEAQRQILIEEQIVYILTYPLERLKTLVPKSTITSES